LVNQLDHFDTVVLLVQSPLLPRGIEAGLLHWVGGGRTRILRIDISPRLHRDRLIEVLGHELQHALEALEDPAVVDGDTMRARFERIGVFRGLARDSRKPFETQAAKDIGQRIRVELAR
jgi:hypothetical protein